MTKKFFGEMRVSLSLYHTTVLLIHEIFFKHETRFLVFPHCGLITCWTPTITTFRPLKNLWRMRSNFPLNMMLLEGMWTFSHLLLAARWRIKMSNFTHKLQFGDSFSSVLIGVSLCAATYLLIIIANRDGFRCVMIGTVYQSITEKCIIIANALLFSWN